jgi:hypothetical protein
MKKSTEARAGREAFTLLEVLAAVAILGIWFSVLASVAIQGQRSEGENVRRIRASLLADKVLSDLELGFDRGDFPDETGDEFERGDFHVSVESLPLTALELAEVDEAFLGILEGELAALAVDLHMIVIRVSWIEGTGEEEVTRVTYGWDSAPLFEQLGAGSADGAIDEPGEEDR